MRICIYIRQAGGALERVRESRYALAMQLIRHRPAAPLDAYIECLWWSRRDQAENSGEHMLPSGRAQLILALHEAPIICRPNAASKPPTVWSRGIVHGPQWSYYQSGPKPPGVVAGAAFRPGVAGAILGVPITELTDRHVPIDALWGARGNGLREQLLAAGSPTNVFRVLERELTARLERPLLIHPAIARALAVHSSDWAHSRVADIQRDVGYSPRHFIALFRASVGLTPKHYYRVKRFNVVLQRIAANPDGSLADLAASTGYSDQSHLTREFREFAGITPTQYRPSGPGSILHHRSNSLIPGPSRPGKNSSRP
jgi:AraC-like DNA-binding protein